MSFDQIRPDLVRFEMRMVQGLDPSVREQKKPGAFGRFLSGFGKVLGAITAPLSFLFPPLGIAALGLYGAGAIGDQMQAKAYGKMQEKMQREQAQNVSFPGLNIGPMPAADMNEFSSLEPTVKQAMVARGNSLTDMASNFVTG